jgi:hypothetical protein
VNDPLLVRGGEAMRHLQRAVDRPARRQFSARERGAQRLSFQELADDVGRAFVRPDVVDRRDVGVVQEARRFRLLLEAVQPVRVVGERRR